VPTRKTFWTKPYSIRCKSWRREKRRPSRYLSNFPTFQLSLTSIFPSLLNLVFMQGFTKMYVNIFVSERRVWTQDLLLQRTLTFFTQNGGVRTHDLLLQRQLRWRFRYTSYALILFKWKSSHIKHASSYSNYLRICSNGILTERKT
jgi:hypothetical protein